MTGRGGAQEIPRPADWRLGGPPPWADRELPELDELLARVAARPAGASEPLGGPPAPVSRTSAVLIALFDEGDGPEVVLTRRTTTLSTHRGEIAFPGGRCDPGETAEQAARREAFEEVGLDPGLPVVVGELDRMVTMISESEIVPVVARLPERPELVANPAEVDRILFVPLAELARPGVWWEERWTYAGARRPIAFFELEDETVWGATGRMLTQLLAIAVGADGGAG